MGEGSFQITSDLLEALYFLILCSHLEVSVFVFLPFNQELSELKKSLNVEVDQLRSVSNVPVYMFSWSFEIQLSV